MHEEPKVPQPDNPVSALGGAVALSGQSAPLGSPTRGPWPSAPAVSASTPGSLTVGKRANPLAVPIPTPTERRDTAPPQTARVTQAPTTSPGMMPAPPALIGAPTPPPAVVSEPTAVTPPADVTTKPAPLMPPAPVPSSPGVVGASNGAKVDVPPAAPSSPGAASAAVDPAASPWSNAPASPIAPVAPAPAELPSAGFKRAESEPPANKLRPMVAKPASRIPLVVILSLAALAAVSILVYIVMKESGSSAFGDPLSVGAPEGKRRALEKPEEEPEATAEPEPPPPVRVPGPLPQPKDDDIYDDTESPAPPRPTPPASSAKPPPEEKYDPSGI